MREDVAIVLIGDIDDSRKLGPDERYEIQETLIWFVDFLNKKHGRKLAIPAFIARGDDFIVVTKDRSIIAGIKADAEVHFPEITFTFGLGWGEVLLDPSVTGQAYYRADKNLVRNKRKKKAAKSPENV